MSIDKLAWNLVDKVDRRKPTIDKYVDPTLFWTGSNAALLWLADRGLDLVAQNTDELQGPAMMGTYALSAAAIVALNKFAIIPLAKKIKDKHKHSEWRNKGGGAPSWLRSAAQVAAFPILFMLTNYQGTLENFGEDARRVSEAFARDLPTLALGDKGSSRTPTSLERLIPKWLDLDLLRRTPKKSTKGSFLRAVRWDNICRKAEKKHRVQRGLVCPVIMHEGYGNPLEISSIDDGGAGTCMFQPGTARAYGLKTYGKSRATGRDRNHGRKLRRLVRKHKWNYDKLRRIDERFDVEKCIPATSRFLRDLYDKHGSWDAALSGYNQGKPARNPARTKYVRKVRKAKGYYTKNKAKLKRMR